MTVLAPCPTTHSASNSIPLQHNRNPPAVYTHCSSHTLPNPVVTGPFTCSAKYTNVVDIIQDNGIPFSNTS